MRTFEGKDTLTRRLGDPVVLDHDPSSPKAEAMCLWLHGPMRFVTFHVVSCQSINRIKAPTSCIMFKIQLQNLLPPAPRFVELTRGQGGKDNEGEFARQSGGRW
jgi:hypothetical protein